MYRLRELESKDITTINAWRNDPELIAFLGAPFRYINADVDAAWFNSYMDNRGNQVRCAIISEGSDEIIGLVSLTNIDHLNQSAEVHIMLGGETHCGKGAGTYALNEIVRHGFMNLNLHRIESEILEYNKRSQHLFEKAGFKKEGVKRKACYKNGAFADMMMYAVLKDE